MIKKQKVIIEKPLSIVRCCCDYKLKLSSNALERLTYIDCRLFYTVKDQHTRFQQMWSVFYLMIFDLIWKQFFIYFKRRRFLHKANKVSLAYSDKLRPTNVHNINCLNWLSKCAVYSFWDQIVSDLNIFLFCPNPKASLPFRVCVCKAGRMNLSAFSSKLPSFFPILSNLSCIFLYHLSLFSSAVLISSIHVFLDLP